MSEHNEKIVNAFGPVRRELDSLRLPLMQQRRYNGIANAIVMMVEHGPINTAAIAHLRAAVMAMVDGGNISAEHKQRISTAFDQFEAQWEAFSEAPNHEPVNPDDPIENLKLPSRALTTVVANDGDYVDWIEDLNLPSRALTCLHKAGITTISQLASKTYRDLWQMPNCGKYTVRDIDSALKARGIVLKGDYLDLG